MCGDKVLSNSIKTKTKKQKNKKTLQNTGNWKKRIICEKKV